MLRTILVVSLLCLGCGKKSNPSATNGSNHSMTTPTLVTPIDAAAQMTGSGTGSDTMMGSNSGSSTLPQ